MKKVIRKQGEDLLKASLGSLALPISKCIDPYSVRHQSQPQIHDVTAKETIKTEMTDLLSPKKYLEKYMAC